MIDSFLNYEIVLPPSSWLQNVTLISHVEILVSGDLVWVFQVLKIRDIGMGFLISSIISFSEDNTFVLEKLNEVAIKQCSKLFIGQGEAMI